MSARLASVLFMVIHKLLRSFTSFLLQKLILVGLSPSAAVILQHLTQTGLFIFSPYIILRENWCASHAAFVVLQACVHFMKMHSYTTVNRYLFKYMKGSSLRIHPKHKRKQKTFIKISLKYKCERFHPVYGYTMASL